MALPQVRRQRGQRWLRQLPARPRSHMWWPCRRPGQTLATPRCCALGALPWLRSPDLLPPLQLVVALCGCNSWAGAWPPAAWLQAHLPLAQQLAALARAQAALQWVAGG